MLSTIEQQLLAQVCDAQQGHVPAFTALVQRCQQLVSSIALSIVRDVDASEDIAQQVFIYVWQHLGELREPSSFLPWLRQITRSRALNYLRDHKLNQRIGGDDAEELLAEFVDPDANPEAWHGREQQSQLLRQFLDALPADSRDLVLLFYREEQNSQQVAALLGISEANVRKKLQRIRESLKTQWLSRYGQLALATAPGVGFSSAVALALAGVSQPAAALTSTAIAANTMAGSSKASGPSMLALLGGAAAGALLALAAVFYGMQPVIRAADTPELQHALRQFRRRSMWMLACICLGWVGAYEFTDGWLGPVATFALLSLHLTLHQLQLRQLLLPQRLREHERDPIAARRQQRRDRMNCWLGLFGGLVVGWAGLLYGLLLSGRFG